MARRSLLDSAQVQMTISRLAQELIENHDDFADSVLLGMQPRGIFLAERIRRRVQALAAGELKHDPLRLGYLDVTFYRDDFRRRDQPIRPNATEVPFIIEGQRVILIDDVLFTGRTVRAALSAMMAFGRPAKVELLVLIDRRYSRDLPIEPNYIGRQVNTIQSQQVRVQWAEQGFDEDGIWLVNQPEEGTAPPQSAPGS